MPTARYRIRNEYGLADQEVHRAADKDDPEALLEGVAMAGLVGVLRQLGDLSEFAAEVFHDLHEEVMATTARGYELMLRVQQLEAEFPLVEQVSICRTDHSHCAYSAGIEWHSNLRVGQNLVTQGDMPRFILDSYEECRGPPRLFMLDKFDVAGAGACLKRYSDPSYFKAESAASRMMESELRREKRTRKLKKRGSHFRSSETESFPPIIGCSQLTASEQVLEKYPARRVRLKQRNLRFSDITSKQSYMESILEEESLEQNDLKIFLIGSHIRTSIDFASDSSKVLNGGATDSSIVRMEVPPLSPRAEATVKIEDPKAEDKFLEAISMLSGVSQKVYPTSQIANQEAMLLGLGIKVDSHAFDYRSSETDACPPARQLTEQNNLLASSGLILSDDHDGYRSDDIGSEMENYVDALNTMESELEADSESRVKLDPGLFNSESLWTDPAINGHLKLQAESSGSGFVGSFGKSVKSEKLKDGIRNLSESTTLVDLSYQPFQERTVSEATSTSEINQSETGKLERTGEDMKLVPLAYLTSNETCYPKQPNATMFSPISVEASSSSGMSDSTLNPKGNFEEEQLLAANSSEAFSGNTESTEVNEHFESSFIRWQTNHIVVLPTTYIECPDICSDILKEINPTEHREDKISENMTDKIDMPRDPLELEDGTFPGKASASFLNDSQLTLMDDGRGRPLEMLEPSTNICLSRGILPTIPLGFTVRESQNMSNELDIVMLSGDLAKEILSNYKEDSGEVEKRLDSSLQFPAETALLPLLVSDDIVSPGSFEKSDNFNVNFVHISNESESTNGSRWKDYFSGAAEKNISDDLSNTFRVPEPPQEQAESSLLAISTVYVEDSLYDSMEDNETYSVDQLSPKSSAFSLEIVSSILQSDSLTTEVKNISMIEEELVHSKSRPSSRNVNIIECEPTISPAIPYELEQSSDVEEAQESAVEEAQESAVISMVEPLPSGCGEDPDARQLQPEVFEFIETNGKTLVNDSLEFVNGSTKLSVQYDQLFLEESTKDNDSNTRKVITGDGVRDQVLHMLQSAKVSSFDVHSQDPIAEDGNSYQPNPDIEELAVTRDSTSLQSQNKSFVPFTQNEDLEMFVNAASRSCPSVLDLSNSSDDKLVDVNVDDIHVELHPKLEVDSICSRKNNQDSDSKYEDAITEDGIDVKVLSLLQSSKVCSFDLKILEDPDSDAAALNQHKSASDESEIADSDSKSENEITEDGTHGQVLSLLQSLYVSSFDAKLQEDPVPEDSSLNQHKQEIEEPYISSDLTFLKFECKFSAPLTKNRDEEESVGAGSSSQLLGLESSNFIDAKLADDNQMKFYCHIYEENLACSREDEQDSDSKASMQHFQVDAGRSEVQSQQASISQAADEPSTVPLSTGGVNIDPSDIRFDEVCSDQPIDCQNNLEHEGLLSEPEPETLPNHGRNSELSMPSSRTDKTEQIETDLSDPFQGVTEHPGSCIASEALTSGSPLVADFIIPNSMNSAQEPLEELAGEMISRFLIQEDIEEAPPIPPLPPWQWRMGTPHLQSLVAGRHTAQPVEKTNPCILPSNTGNQETSSFVALSAPEERFQLVSSCIDGQMKESVKLSELLPIAMDLRQQLEIRSPEVKTVHSSDMSLIISCEEDGKHANGKIAMDGENTFTIPSLKDVMPLLPDLLEAGNREEMKQKLFKFLPGLELERLQEAPIIDRDAVATLNSFPVVSTGRDGKCQYVYGDYEGYEGEDIRHHNLSGPFQIAAQGISHYGYHLFVKNGNSSNIYDIMSAEMEGDKPNGKPYSIRNRPRDPLIEAVAAHDKSTLRKVSELDWSLTKPMDDERNYLLEQIKNKSFNLRPTTSARQNILKAHPTNLKVAAILEKANTIRQACVGSDEDNDDNWTDS